MYLHSLSWAHYRLGHKNEAVQTLEQARTIAASVTEYQRRRSDLAALEELQHIGRRAHELRNALAAAVMTFFNLVAIIATVLGIRQSVYSPKTTEAIAERAAETGDTDIGNPPKG